MEPIIESEMQFGPYSDDEVFWIENCQLYKRRLDPNGVKCCEFILDRGKNVYFIEAKTTCPNQITAESSDEKVAKYNEYITDITEKMCHSLAVYASILLNRHGAVSELPPNLKKLNLSRKTLKFVLVVKTAEQEWLEPLQNVLNKALRKNSSIWNDVRLYAINEDKAREKRFVI